MPRALLVAYCVVVFGTSMAVPTAAAAGPPTYRPPVAVAISDPFRPPPTPYAAGNRGLDYATAAGTPVHAAADGRVVFAGAVAGSLHVTILHPDGVRTTYSFLARVDVVVGQPLRQGDVVGITLGALHFGARRGDAYFDPASLFDQGSPRVRLVPFDEPPGSGATGERRAVLQLIGGLAGWAGDATGAVATWLRDDGGQLARTAAHYASRFAPPVAYLDAARTLAEAWDRARLVAGRQCSAATVEPTPPAERRVAVLVAGLGSDSTGSPVDQVRTDVLGYEASDVLRFSYAGGRVPDPSDAFADIASTSYGAADTGGDLRGTGARLANLVEAVVARAPGVPVDLYGHSQGGVVVRLALIELERRHGVKWLRAVGLVATLGSPHGGADLATAVDAWSSTPAGSAALDAVAVAAHQELDHDAPSVAQLAETSDLVAELADHPVPPMVRAVSIAARGDLIVPVPRTAAPGMELAVVPLIGPSAHRDLPSSPPATRELALALAGLPPGCSSFAQALLDQGTGEAISFVEDLVGAVGLAVVI